MKLEGLYTVVVTPFDKENKIDKEGLRKNLRFQLKHHVNGIVVLGTTGEAPTLTPSEKRVVVEIAVEEVKGKAELLVGTGSYSTEQTIALTKEAQEIGADGALIVIPYYNKPTQEGLYRHFMAISHAVSLPICLYNIQSRTGQNLETSTLKRLFNCPTLRGVKESSGNMMQINEVLEMVRTTHSSIKILSGDDALALPITAIGGNGVFSVASNLFPGQMQQFITACLKGDYAQARALHYQLLPFFKAIFIETNPIPIKAAMQHCGMAAGGCRLPLCEMNSTNHQKLKEIINSLPISWLGGYG